jgi:putative FmdB family regulatory protein
MPIYEYEPKDRECLMCDQCVEVLQGIDEPALALCPYCGLDVVRIVSRVSFSTREKISPEKAAKKGFSTFRRAGKGTWEKVAGPEGDPQEKSGTDGVVRPSDFEEPDSIA